MEHVLDPVSVALATEFTRRNEHTSRLTETLTAFKSLLDACPLPMFLATTDGQVVYANNAYTSLVHANQEDLVGHGWLKFIHEEDIPLIEAYWRRAIAHATQHPISDEIRSEELKVRYVTMDGVVVSVNTRICQVLNGNYAGFIFQPENVQIRTIFVD